MSLHINLTYFLLWVKVKVKQQSKMSDEKTTQRKLKGGASSSKLLRFKKNQKETAECELQALRVDFEPDTKPPPTFVFSQEKSEIITPVSAHTLKLLEAIREDKLEFVEEELSCMNKQDIDKTDRHGFALIHVAARYNLHRIVTSLLEHGADINIGTSEYRWTPLHLAARCVRFFFYSEYNFIFCNFLIIWQFCGTLISRISRFKLSEYPKLHKKFVFLFYGQILWQVCAYEQLSIVCIWCSRRADLLILRL